MLNIIDQVIVDDEMATQDYDDAMILLEEETERIPADLREKVMNGEYL